MAKKKGKSNGEEQQQGEKKSPGKENNEAAEKSKTVTAVFKVDLHCEGCAAKVVKRTRAYHGVESVKCDLDSDKLTVIGGADVDLAKLREKIETKTHKKVELISPLPKKEGKENKDAKENKKDEKKSKGVDEKKSKEPAVTTHVLKINCHCDGCAKKIYKLVTRTQGYKEMKIDKQKDLLTVTGAMDIKALAESLNKHLKKVVEIVPPKKEGDKKEKNDGEKKEKGGGSGGSGGGNGGEQRKGGGDGKPATNGGASGGGGESKMLVQPGYPHPFVFGPGLGYASGPDQFQFHYHYYPPAPGMFSDENPNACSVM